VTRTAYCSNNGLPLEQRRTTQTMASFDVSRILASPYGIVLVGSGQWPGRPVTRTAYHSNNGVPLEQRRTARTTALFDVSRILVSSFTCRYCFCVCRSPLLAHSNVIPQSTTRIFVSLTAVLLFFNIKYKITEKTGPRPVTDRFGPKPVEDRLKTGKNQ
jgi:hypothetical protein